MQSESSRSIESHYDAAIVGAGPAGLMAAACAAQRGLGVVLLDKNREPGVKILISGGTRCNLTHATDARGIVEAFGPNGRFLHSALAALGPQQVVDLFEAEGVPTKAEPSGKIFPASDRAIDVRNALVRRAVQAGSTLAMSQTLLEIARTEAGFRLTTARQTLDAKCVLLATGGQSYPACGTTGDGYRFAAALGHRIVRPHPALVPITSHADWVLALQGITLSDVVVEVVMVEEETRRRGTETTEQRRPPSPLAPLPPAGEGSLWVAAARPLAGEGSGSGAAARGRRPMARRRGALLFAHFGVTGPAAMDVSHAVSESDPASGLVLRCDLLPDIKELELETLLAAELAGGGKRRVASLLDPWLPHRVGETLLGLVGVPPERPMAEFSKTDRRRLARAVKRLDIPAAGTMGYRKAELTAGGVALEEVDSRTMQSRIVPGLFFAGELLDLNGPVGGFNFQAAFSTGWLAGKSFG